MKTVIQHIVTALFLTRWGTWAENPSDALPFIDEVRARDYAFLHGVDEGVCICLEEKALRGRLEEDHAALEPRQKPPL